MKRAFLPPWQVHNFTSPREVAAMRQVVCEQALVEWRSTMAEEKHLLTAEATAMERLCIGKPTDKHVQQAELHAQLQFIDHPCGVEVRLLRPDTNHHNDDDDKRVQHAKLRAKLQFIDPSFFVQQTVVRTRY